jgi:flavodoxin I
MDGRGEFQREDRRSRHELEGILRAAYKTNTWEDVMTGIFFGSTTGNTENAARAIQQRLEAGAEVLEVTEMSAESLEKYDTLLLGSSTWGDGELQDDWEQGIEVLRTADLSGKKVGIFGCGDQFTYPDTFADALGIIYGAIEHSGATLVGAWPTDGYEFSESKSVVDGKFVGLVLDEDNQSDLTGKRIAAWTDLLK